MQILILYTVFNLLIEYKSYYFVFFLYTLFKDIILYIYINHFILLISLYALEFYLIRCLINLHLDLYIYIFSPICIFIRIIEKKNQNNIYYSSVVKQ